MDRFDRKHLAYRKAQRMSVPAAQSAKCETREHDACTGQAISVLTDRQTRCSCNCHKRPKGMAR